MVTFRLNGQPVSAVDVPPHTSVLEFLRARGLTGSKEGCAEGECGACAIALVTPHGAGSAYRVVNSCLMNLPMAHGHEIYTIEGLAGDGALLDVQKAMAAGGGSQCGYCTPGFVMSLFAEQHRPDREGPCDPHATAGNLCRCTGYRPIRDAALSLGPAPAGPFRDRLARPAPPIDAYDSVGFSRPATVDACIQQLTAHPEARVIAGGTDLGVEANLRHRRWAHLVSLDAVQELREVTSTPERISLGASLPLSDIAAGWRDAPAAVHEWVTLFASPLIRHRATLGGNLVTASPIGDAAPLLLALGASVTIAGPSGRRIVPLADFFTAYRKTALRDAEIVTTIHVPRPWPETLAFYKVAKRRFDDISTVAAGIAIVRDAAGIVMTARIALGGVAATPLRVVAAERALVGRAWDRAAVSRAQEALGASITPMSDHRGSAAYRLDVSKALLEKCWWEHGA